MTRGTRMKKISSRAVAILALLATGSFAALAQAQAPGTHLRMGLVNIRSLYSDTPDPQKNKANIALNLERHAYFIDKLAAKGVEFIGFPELSINGYRFSKNTT